MRGEAIGIEIGPLSMRGVRLAPAAHEPVVAAEEIALRRLDETTLIEGFVRLREVIDAGDLPTRIAYFAPGNVLQTADITGADTDELRRLRSRHDERNDVARTSLVDNDAHRWLVATTWNEAVVDRLRHAATEAGFADVEVEPAPVALARTLSSTTLVVHRTVDAGAAWSMLSRDGLPLAASTLRVDATPPPALHVDTPLTTIVPVDPLTPTERVSETVHSVVADTLSGARREDDIAAAVEDEATDGLHLAPSVVGKPLPPHPEHDPRAPVRIAVAAGAAIGAAGLGTRVRKLDAVTTPASSGRIDRRPYAVAPADPVVDAPQTPMTSPRRSSRVLAKLRSRRIPSGR
ncbi:MAG: hypothetical protein AAFP84_12535 [Actinomycetota bacterium]